MKTHTFKMTRVYETIIEIDSENVKDAFNKLQDVDVYQLELEQCNVVQERIELESDTCNANKQKDTKRMIIENFMLWYTGELTEETQDSIYEYVENDHVNELTK
jgi:hypothetical protein